MSRQEGLFEKLSIGSNAKRRLSFGRRLTTAVLILPGLALGQAATPSADGSHKETAGAKTAAPSLDPNATITQGQAAALLEEMRRLELLLKSRAQSAVAGNDAPNAGANRTTGPVTLQLQAAEHSLGDPGAPIVMVEFADLQCPFCKDFQESTFPTLDRDYIKTGKVRFVVRDLPLKNHMFARPAAEAVRCAGEQGKYWELRNALLARSGPPSPATISADAEAVHLEMTAFEQCQGGHSFSTDIDAEESEADRLGIGGTPAFLIGRPVDGKMQGVVIQGSRTIDVYREEIERVLKEGAEHMGSAPGTGATVSPPKDKPG